MILAVALVAAQIAVPDNVVLFALVGQSNMSGRGAVADAPDLLVAADDVVVFGNDYDWHEGQEPVDSAAGQVDTVSVDGTAAIGPGLSFAIAYRDMHPGVVVGLIPCAKGGTTIHEWRRQSLVDSTLTPIRSNLYGSCLHRIRTALAESAGAVLGGVLMFQGESDARPATAYAQPFTYAAQLVRWVKVLRADLDLPALPFVFAELGTTTDPALTAWSTVKAQQGAARAALTRAGMVETDDLPLAVGDALHFSTSSYIEIGRRFAEAMTAVENQP